MKKINSKSIVSFLESHPLINVSALERACDIPTSTIKNALNGQREIPEKHLQSIVKLLISYGLK